MDPCNAINVVCVDLNDSDPAVAGERWFHDHSGEYLMFTPTPATGSGGYVSAAMGYKLGDTDLDELNAYVLMVTGLRAGVDATTGKPVVKMAEVEVIATDAGGLETKAGEEAVWVVNVDPAPIVKAGVSPNTRAITLTTTPIPGATWC